MPYYLAPYVGAGTTLDPFRPRGSDQPGWSAIDLRPDGGATLGGGGLNACFLHLPLANPDPLLQLLSLAPTDTLGPLVKALLKTRLNLTTAPTATQWADVAAELLLTPPPGAWKALRPTIQGQHEIWLGGLLKRLPVIAGGLSFSENWNCADSTIINCQLTWTEVNGDSSIVANQINIVTIGGAYGASGRAESDLNGANHECSIDATTLTDTTTAIAANVRFQSAADTYYCAEAQKTATQQIVLRKNVNATFTDLQSTAHTWALPETVKCRVSGSTLTYFIGGVQQGTAVTDTAIAGGTRCGFRGYVTAGNTSRGDNWLASDLAAAGSVVSPRSLALLGVGA